MTGKHVTLAIATVLAAGVAPAVLGGPAAAAPLTAVAATGTVRVVQEGGPLVVPSGEEGAVTTRIKVTLPAGRAGPVMARLLLPNPTWELPDFDTPAYEPVTPTCSVNGGAFWPCLWDSPGNEVVFPATESATTVTYDVRVDADSRAAVRGNLAATLEVTDGAGAVIGSGRVAFQFAKGTPENHRRTAVLARDKAGVLWQYESSGRPDKPLKARERIGGGWNAYTSITPLTQRTAAGEGDLVARDKAGVLWCYKGSGNPDAPFKPRVRVGGGWNTYTAITSRAGGLVARDKAGVLWHYNATGHDAPQAPFDTRQNIGGWNAYTALVGNWSDFTAVARDRAGVLWSHGFDYPIPGGDFPGPEYAPRVRVGGGWNVYERIALAGQLSGSSENDFLARDTQGRLWLYEGVNRAGDDLVPGPTRRKIGWDWDIYDTIL
ncbi:hypothetical protein ACFRR6_03000 [Streptomyces sp. NPDC056891]|uniref:hypothetical protein n=1 Tax=Streptomyces sp. NPDC056891 TaxID=3345961 RepID=UPI00369FE61E